MIERRVEVRAIDAAGRDERALAHERAPRIEAHPRELREAVELRERFRETDERAFDVRCDAERLCERGERARRHKEAERRREGMAVGVTMKVRTLSNVNRLGRVFS